MRRLWLALVIAAAFAGCAGDARQWMKVEGTYTAADFRRDYAACSKQDVVDDACMQARGWVAVRAGKPDQPAVPESERSRGLGYRPRVQ